VAGSRIVVGAAALAIVALVSGGLRRAGGRRGLVLVAGTCVAVYQACFFAAVADTGVAVGTVVALGSAPPSPGWSAASWPASA
jgi:DME family drug/metabolite transporter